MNADRPQVILEGAEIRLRDLQRPRPLFRQGHDVDHVPLIDVQGGEIAVRSGTVVRGRGEAFAPREGVGGETPAEQENPPQRAKFEPCRGKIRKSGTGGIYRINDHLFEGRYTPTNAHGKREVHTVYAKTREEVEPLLERMITEVRAKIKEEKQRMKEAADGSEPVAG